MAGLGFERGQDRTAGRCTSRFRLVGGIRGSLHEAYPFPTPSLILNFVRIGATTLKAMLPASHRQRINGLQDVPAFLAAVEEFFDEMTAAAA